MVSAPSMSCPSVAITTRIPARTSGEMANHIAAAAGSITTTVGWTTTSSPSISGAGLVGFKGETTAPIPMDAKYDTTKYRLFPHNSTTTSPRFTPRRINSPRIDPTC